MNNGITPMAPTVNTRLAADLCGLVEGEGAVVGLVRWLVLVVSEVFVPFRRMAFRWKNNVTYKLHIGMNAET